MKDSISVQTVVYLIGPNNILDHFYPACHGNMYFVIVKT